MDKQRVIEKLNRLIDILLAMGVQGFVIISESQLQQLLGMVQLLGPELDAYVRDVFAQPLEAPGGVTRSLVISEARWKEFLGMAQRRLNDGTASLDEESLERLVAWIEEVYASAERPLTSVGELVKEVCDASVAPPPESVSAVRIAMGALKRCPR